MELEVLPGRMAVCRLEADSPVPVWAKGQALFSLTWTADEFSMVCDEDSVPENIPAERGWRVLKVQGPLAFSMVGVLAELSGLLAGAGVSIFALSTFDTDYILVKEERLETAIQALRHRGHQFLQGV